MLPKMDGQQSQQFLQQQPEIQKQELHHLQSPTTPSWSIADKIVKGELSDEKNDDSGVSPGHYTSNSGSPRSRRSSSVMNCSLSPGSSISDSQSIMQCTAYDYSPSSYKPVNSPLTFRRMNSMEEDALEGKNDHQEVGGPSTSKQPLYCSYQCPVCNYTTTNRLTFTQHLMVHYTPNPNSAYDRPIMDQDGGVSPTMSGDNRSEFEYEESEDVPRINSQGKVKTYKCKQCNYVSITKVDFWQHSRGHIRNDKLLTCHKCPFVTQYKHHLEYHLRKHNGDKPFKCNLCSYKCVNKSMLNSHFKSHSNVYQYSCANCSYATKYCHSLKMHLRKTNHQPGMVLNADGSPNPLPIIDVYGTRRGPKTKSIKMEENQYNMQGQLNNNLLGAISPPIVPPQMMIPTSMPPMGPAMNMPVMSNGPNRMNNLVPNQIDFLNVLATYNQLLGTGYPMTNSIALQLQAYLEYNRSINNEKMIEDSLLNNIPAGPIIPVNEMKNPEKNDMVSIAEKCDLISENCNDDEKYENSKQEEHFAEQKSVNNLKKTGTSRRKGKAVKLDKHILEKDSDDEQDYEKYFNKSALTVSNESLSERNNSDFNDKPENADQFTCQYCEMSFGNDVMYTVHMGYHGYQNPFTCNMCGHQSSDKLSFFMHIAKSKH